MNSENVNNNIITCPACGAGNLPNTKFCTKCGSPLEANNMNTIPNSTTTSIFQTESTPVSNFVPNQEATENKTSKMNYFGYMIGAFLKPFDKYKEEENNLADFKNSAIIAAILVLGMTIMNLISTILNTVRVKSFWSDKVEWVWENLKEVEFIKVIGMDLLLYAGIIAGIAAVYYLASLVIKKESKYPKLLGIAATACIPAAVCMTLVSPIFSLINGTLSAAISIAGFIYTIVILIELTNEIIQIENKNTRIYFQFICLTIIVLVLGFVLYKIVLGSLTSGLGSISSILR